jgi:hypothetical protein
MSIEVLERLYRAQIEIGEAIEKSGNEELKKTYRELETIVFKIEEELKIFGE